LSPVHLKNVTKKQRARYGETDADPEARRAVVKMRRDLIALFAELGATFMQSGKLYPYLQGLDAAERADTHALKRLYDPEGLMNPGALGL